MILPLFLRATYNKFLWEKKGDGGAKRQRGAHYGTVQQSINLMRIVLAYRSVREKSC